MPRIFITGTAGFIGFHLARRLLDDGHAVFGLDNFNDYYSVQLKLDRHAQLEKHPNYRWLKADLADLPALQQVFADFSPVCVVNLAAQPGMRYSITNPQVYQKSNTITATCPAISPTWTT
jgi:UDP-glucuronate 4-epimerase